MTRQQMSRLAMWGVIVVVALVVIVVVAAPRLR